MTTRVTLDLTDEMYAALVNLADDRGETKSFLLRLGLTHLLEGVASKEEGYCVGAWKADGDQITQAKIFIMV